MFVAPYRNTERGIVERMAGKLESQGERLRLERAAKVEAQRVAWQAKVELEVARKDELTQQAAACAEAMRKALGDAYRPTYARIEARALKVFKLTRAELHSPRRFTRITIARQFVAYWACRRLTWLSLPQIGRRLGGFDHTTVLHAKRVYPKKRAAAGRHLRVLP